MKSAFTFIFFIAALCAQAQNNGQAAIDSMIKTLPGLKEDTTKAKILSGISFNYILSNTTEGIKYGNLAKALSEKLKWKKGIALACNNLGLNYQYKGDFNKALEYLKKAAALNEETRSRRLLAMNYGNLGNLLMSEGKFPEALDYLLKALKIFEELGVKSSIAIQYGGIGSIYEQEKEYSKALHYDSLSYTMYASFNDKEGMAIELGNIGNIYDDMNRHDKAIEYDLNAVKILEEIGDKTGLARNYGNISIIYESLKQYDKQIEYLEKSAKIYKELGDESSIARTNSNIGEFYRKIASDSIGPIYYPDENIPDGKNERLKKSIYYYNLAYPSAKANNDQVILQYITSGLSLAYEGLGNYKDALKYYKEYTAVTDSMFSNDNKVKITNLETQREIDLKDKQIKIDQLEVEKKRNERVFFVGGIILLLLIIGIIFRNYRLQQKSNHMLSIEKKRSDDLLLNILPAEVAEELKSKGSADAKLFDDVTVMFTDFVNFTKAGEIMSPGELIGELDTCFKAFDGILNKYHIEKIKTIGDAYLAVSGLPAANPNHAKDMVAAAIEIRDYMNERRKSMGDKTFDMRVGLHSGNVVAGIVGLKKFAYDIWGDTVNIAARMEQNSEPLRINISQTTYDLVKEYFTCIYRGEIDAKNKGKMNMYFVENAKS